MSPAPPPAEATSTVRAGKRLRGRLAWLIASLVTGLIVGLLARYVGASNDVIMIAVVFGSLCFSHVIFFETLFDAHAVATRRGRLIRNLLWSVGYVLVFVALYAGLFALTGLRSNDMVVTGDFGLALFFSVITWTTVGYGDVTPAGPFSQFVAGVEALNGYLVMAVFIAALIRTFERLASEQPD